MPLFDFECQSCRARVERLFKSAYEADRTSVYCDSCIEDGDEMIARVHMMRRIPAVSNFALKGAGFHVNDYPRKN